MSELSGRALDEAVAVECLGWLWVKHRDGVDSEHPGTRFLVSPEDFEKYGGMFALPIFVRADGTEPIWEKWTIPPYSWNIADAWFLVENLKALTGRFDLAFTRDDSGDFWTCSFEPWETSAHGKTAPEAISRAALAAVRAREKAKV